MGSPSRNTMSLAHPSSTGNASKQLAGDIAMISDVRKMIELTLYNVKCFEWKFAQPEPRIIGIGFNLCEIIDFNKSGLSQIFSFLTIIINKITDFDFRYFFNT